MTESKSILEGVGGLVDDWLGPFSRGSKTRYRHKSAANQLNKRSSIPSSKDFLQKAYEQIDHNWHVAKNVGLYTASKENWRLTQRDRFPEREARTDKTSKEVGLERDIIKAADNRWANQVPTSSGLVGHTTGKTRNIDLVIRGDNNHFSLIELKVKSNNPLFAAIEILQYGLLFAWSRNNQSALSYDTTKQPVLLAESIDLCVLAPATYYEGLNLSNLSHSINDGLASAQDTFGIPFTFRFTRFDDEFSLNDTPLQLLEKATNRIPIW